LDESSKESKVNSREFELTNRNELIVHGALMRIILLSKLVQALELEKAENKSISLLIFVTVELSTPL